MSKRIVTMKVEILSSVDAPLDDKAIGEILLGMEIYHNGLPTPYRVHMSDCVIKPKE